MITQEQYKLQTGETTDAYNTRIAGLRASGETSAPITNPPTTADVNNALGGEYFNPTTGAQAKPFVPAPITNPVTPSRETPNSEFTPPTPTAPGVYEQYTLSATENLANLRKQLEATYKSQIEDYQKKIDASNTQIEGYKNKILDTIEAGDPTKSSSYEQEQRIQQNLLDAAESGSQNIKTNFEANQKLVGELESLLIEGNTLIQQQQNAPVPTFIGRALTSKTMQDVAARAGVIEAVMSARTGQITEAYRMIDKSAQTIAASRKDQLDYYKSLQNFYAGQVDDEGNKLITLEKDQKDFIDRQISLNESDLKRLEENAENIKNGMTDPDTAQAYADAGVTLNDSPKEINEKLATYGYNKEVREKANEMGQEGYTYLVPGQEPPAGTEIASTVDSRGVVKDYYRVKKATATTIEEKKQEAYSQASKFLTDNPDASYQELSAGILQNTILTQAEITAFLGSQGRENIPPPPNYTKVATDYKNAGWTREAIEKQYTDEGKEIPADFKKALDEVFGKEPGMLDGIKNWWESL